jgi:plastocyanin
MNSIVRRIAPLGVAFAFVLVAQGSAFAATTPVSIVNFAFSPATVTVLFGGTVQWTNNAGTTTHTSTSGGFDACCPSGPALWQSGNIAGGGTFPFVFTTAGSYPYHCSIHTTMQGTVKVRGRAQPTTGTVTTPFKITWATSIPAGYVVNVQIKRPTGVFTAFLTGTTLRNTMFTPDAGVGTYQFRTQLQSSGNPALRSGFSPNISITVS